MPAEALVRAAAVFFASAALLCAACPAKPELPVIGRVPDFTLTDQRGRAVHGRDLDGKVVVADFIFTRCTTVCPMLTAQMANFRRRLGEGAERVQFISITVDPGHDTPQVLAAYAQRHGAPSSWLFLTGDVASINRVVVQGFRVAMGAVTADTAGDQGEFDILHAQHFVLVDKHRRIRGYYRTDEASLDELAAGVEALLD
jgi:protein SCO1/2